MEQKRNCPICKKETIFDGNPYYPFCSERCKVIDLAAWVEGKYFVPGEEVSPESKGEEGEEGEEG